MAKDTKTVSGSLIPNSNAAKYDPLSSIKAEAIDRMKTAMLAASLDDPLSAATAIRQVTIMRVYHQVSRIVQYLDLMDKLEESLYKNIESELNLLEVESLSDSNFNTISKLLAIQEKLQKSIIESNKLLAPYLDMEQYPAFNTIEVSTPVSDNILSVESEQRNSLRETASSVLKELEALSTTSDKVAEN